MHDDISSSFVVSSQLWSSSVSDDVAVGVGLTAKRENSSSSRQVDDRSTIMSSASKYLLLRTAWRGLVVFQGKQWIFEE